MPVDDIPVHPMTSHTDRLAGCNTERQIRKKMFQPYRTAYGEKVKFAMSRECRQVGERVNGAWQDLSECRGCQYPRNTVYIEESRKRIDGDTK